MDFLLELRYRSLEQGLRRTGDGMELSQVTLGAVLPEEEARFRDCDGDASLSRGGAEGGRDGVVWRARGAASGWRWRRFRRRR